MRHSALLLAVARCHTQIIYMWKQNYYLLNSIQNFSPNYTGFPVTNHTIHVIISLLCLLQQETWRARWWSSTMKLYLSQKKASQIQIFTGTAYAPFTAKQSSTQERILYQTESLELHHLISHLSKICSLGQSVPHLPSCVPVTVGSWTVTRPALPVAYQMFVRSVEWHHTP